MFKSNRTFSFFLSSSNVSESKASLVSNEASDQGFFEQPRFCSLNVFKFFHVFTFLVRHHCIFQAGKKTSVWGKTRHCLAKCSWSHNLVSVLTDLFLFLMPNSRGPHFFSSWEHSENLLVNIGSFLKNVSHSFKIEFFVVVSQAVR